MNFDKDSPIDDSEYLYRAFHFLEWSFKDNRPSSRLFYSRNSSLSVDRDGGRVDSEIIENFRQRDKYKSCGLVKHTARFYRECETEPIPDPETGNDYHALVNGKDMIGTKQSHAKKLCKKFDLVIMAES